MAVRYNRVEPTVWIEPWDDDTRMVALYLLTCSHRATEGIYRLPLSYALEDLRWDQERFDTAFDELRCEDFVRHDQRAQVVWIVKAFERQPPENKNVAIAALRRIKELPKTVLLHPFLTVAQRLSQPFADALGEGFPELLGDSLALTQALTNQASTATQPLRASESPGPLHLGKVA